MAGTRGGKINRRWLAAWGFLLAASALFGAGCASSPRAPAPNLDRHFNFTTDAFAYANELKWEYRYDAQGKWTTQSRHPRPQYYQHCFVVARSARQFFLAAAFDPALPKTNEKTYARLIRKVVSTNPRNLHPRVVVIPGYADLHAFSQDHEALLKANCGGAWQSYFQRGHWRMIFPFSRRHQHATAEHLVQRLQTNEPAVVHIVRFPQLTINHAVVFLDAEETPESIRFRIYDPNSPREPRFISFDRASRTFNFPANDYFPGGRIDAYEIYSEWND